jgi:hypothetical protein
MQQMLLLLLLLLILHNANPSLYPCSLFTIFSSPFSFSRSGAPIPGGFPWPRRNFPVAFVPTRRAVAWGDEELSADGTSVVNRVEAQVFPVYNILVRALASVHTSGVQTALCARVLVCLRAASVYVVFLRRRALRQIYSLSTSKDLHIFFMAPF